MPRLRAVSRPLVVATVAACATAAPRSDVALAAADVRKPRVVVSVVR